MPHPAPTNHDKRSATVRCCHAPTLHAGLFSWSVFAATFSSIRMGAMLKKIAREGMKKTV